MSAVYFADARARVLEESLINKLSIIIEASGILDCVEQGGIVAIKLHVGERWHYRHVRPQFVRVIVDKIKECGGKPFITDSCTLYSGFRHNAVDHFETAIMNGFSYATVGAPFIPADGIKGKYGRVVRIDGKILKEVEIAGVFSEVDFVVVLSHVKGHGLAGFGGALKNIAMGCVTRKEKARLHMHGKPKVLYEYCIGCGTCAKICPVGAISVAGKANIDAEKCLGCGECVVSCPRGAIRFDPADSIEFQVKMADAVLGFIKLVGENNIAYINFVLDVTPYCDCFAAPDIPVVPDVGILASRDPVAIDQASIDLINKARPIVNPDIPPDVSDVFKSMHNIDWTILLTTAEELGIGKREYVLRTIHVGKEQTRY